MYNSIVKAVRKTISADKNRFENEEYDLDLTYITERVIAMSFPADGVESAYRNSIYDVSKMLNENHKNNYLIYNLSERKYDYSLFNKSVVDWCGFPDHHAPPLGLLFKIVKTIYDWLGKDPLNVVIVHCMAGKGRTGTVISCLLQYGGLFDSASDAMRYFAVKRSNNNYGITGPSQIRYTQYFSELYLGGKDLNPSPVFLKSISMVTIPKFFLGPLKQGICPVLNIYSATQKGVRIFTSAPIEGDTKETRTYQSGNATIIFEVRKIVRGDILLVFSHITPFYRVEQICRANFHTGMFSMPTLILTKSDLDGADGDKRFSNDFNLKLEFQEVVNNNSNGSQSPLIEASTSQSILEYQKEIKKEIKWIRHEAIKKDPKNGSVFFLPKNNSEKIKQAKDIASKQGTFGVHSGFLLKKGHNFKSWRRRWFVLKDNLLSYYKSPKDTTPAGVIPVNEILDISIKCEISQQEGHDYCFEIITHKASYLISAENEKDLEDWTEILNSAIKMIQSTGRLFIEILEAKYEPNVILQSLTDPSAIIDINDHPIDIITYLTIHLGKKRDTTSHKSMLFNPIFQYAGDFAIYNEPCDLVVSLWVRSSVQNIKDTLAAEFVLNHKQLMSSYNTEWREFNRIKSNLLTNMSLKFGSVYRCESDLSLHENALGSLQSPNQFSNSPGSFNSNENRKSIIHQSVSFNHSLYQQTPNNNNNNIDNSKIISNNGGLSNSLNFNSISNNNNNNNLSTNVSTSAPSTNYIFLAKSREENHRANSMNSNNNSNNNKSLNNSNETNSNKNNNSSSLDKTTAMNSYGFSFDGDDEDKLIKALENQLNDTQDDDELISDLQSKLDYFEDIAPNEDDSLSEFKIINK
ncbi:hypothetical protein DICPUDRAFT_25009 [Dictyostelium purpureum]|uniref:Phosphatidylinositol-3,4,5-trisphosphate 3-phosphatase n=1 Tax=Dictyostelium purpureum TaxID=5786 RepID=F0Z675_DICPU|nr:uncharacterized protein DICPUDRAFT_25009 [Dictyostelium purpureum]EGC40549.1 hypothetical protein DICPUDRAFT_25009 [Dictyostelium purpureum]|eukprot:XP_003282885.1 hypothetical protein DICPUDRAFT_25009 [Dictyostelium purpureum]